MNDFEFVQVLASFNELVDVALSFKFSKPFSPPYELIQGLVSANFKHDIHIFLVFKILFENNNLFVV